MLSCYLLAPWACLRHNHVCQDASVFKKLLSYLLGKLTVDVSHSSSCLEIHSGVLTVQHKDGNKIFDLSGGINPQLAAELAQLGIKPSDLDNLVQMTQQAASGSNKLLAAQPSVITKRWTFSSGSPNVPGASSSQPTSGQVSALGLTSTKLFKSGSVSLTVRSDGRERTYGTTFGINDETRREMAQQLGISVEELDTLLKVEEHAAEHALEPARSPASTEGQTSAADFPPVGSKPQMVVCPRCARQVALAPRCLYCGEQLEGKTGVPIG